MHSSPEYSRCPICRAENSPGEVLCGTCGSSLAETHAQEIRNLNYLLSQLSCWEEDDLVGHEQANKLRDSYERRREGLRAQLNTSRKRTGGDALPQEASNPAPKGVSGQPSLSTDSPPRATRRRSRRGTLLETLTDPHTIRILLYTGAPMLVVGVIIGLRDILYLKLQEPVVQAALLATGTIIFTVSGWWMILRTRVLLTGRALTLTGSLLVPINFWFLARSGLLEKGAQAWLVCALCALLYATTAAILREKLYVYLAGLAVIAIFWALIYRVEREAFGLYTLTLMSVSLAFLHLSRLFPAGTDDGRLIRDVGQPAKGALQSAIRNPQSSWSYQLWGPPLVHVALAGAALSLLLYMPLRLGSTPSLTDGLFHLRASQYDSSIAILLFAAASYATWFAGRRIFTERRTILYTLSALCLFCVEFLTADGLRVSGSMQLLLLASTSFIVALMARSLKSDAWALAFQSASLMVTVALAFVTYPVITDSHTSPLTHSLILILLVLTYAGSGSSRLRETAAVETLTHVALAFMCVALVVVQAAIHLRVGDSSLLLPSVALGATGALLFVSGFRVKREERVRYFRAGLFALIIAIILAALRASFDPVRDVEIYTSPVGILLLLMAYLSVREHRGEDVPDTNLLLWAGSCLVIGPLLIHALQYRLFLGVPAPSRDLLTLCASLGLIIFGVIARARSLVLVGGVSLVLELAALALTSVDWVQIPLKVYLISTGALILLIWGLLEFRRDQILLMRRRLHEQRETARERIREWR